MRYKKGKIRKGIIAKERQYIKDKMLYFFIRK